MVEKKKCIVIAWQISSIESTSKIFIISNTKISIRKVDNSDGSYSSPCRTIYEKIARQLLLSMGIAFLLTVSSMIIDKVLKFLSHFEKYTDLNEEYTSRVYKGFLLKYLNSGFLILLLNLRFKVTTNTSLGNYDDLTPNWYSTIGYSVIFSFALKFISLFVWTFYRCFVPGLRKCCDRSCTCDMKKTKTKSMADYIAVYMGAEYDFDFSYTEILKTLLIMMTFGPMLPIVYIIAFFHLILLYWRDKILLLTVYKFPPYFDNRINERARRILSYGIPIFCIASIWTFGNPNVLEETTIKNFNVEEYSQKALNQDMNTFLGPFILFFKRCVNNYGIVFFAVLALYIIILIMR